MGSEFNTVDCILNPGDRKAADVFPGPRAGRNRQRKNVRLLSLVDLSNPPRFFEQVGGGTVVIELALGEGGQQAVDPDDLIVGLRIVHLGGPPVLTVKQKKD